MDPPRRGLALRAHSGDRTETTPDRSDDPGCVEYVESALRQCLGVRNIGLRSMRVKDGLTVCSSNIRTQLWW